MERFCKAFRRILALALILTLFSGGFPLSAKAETFQAMVTSETMNVYKDAAMTEWWAEVSKYTIVDVLSYNGNTARIQKGKNIGYARISDMQSLESLFIPAVINRNCSVYQTASTSSKKTSVKKNLAVNIIAENGKWVMLERNGAIAYTYKSYVTVQEPAVNEPVQDPVVYEEFEASVSASSVKVYSAASTTSSYLGTLSKITKVTVLAYNSTWARIRLNEKIGYCLRSALSRTPLATATPTPSPTTAQQSASLGSGATYENFFATVSKTTARVYASASSSSKYLGSMSLGTVVEVHAYNKTWVYISLNGRYGYTLRTNLTRQTSSEPTATPTPTHTPAPTLTPNPAETPKPGTLTQSEIFASSYSNEKKIYLFLTDVAGYSSAAACGILANMKHESGFRPEAVSSSGNYHGLCQWSNTRFQTISNYCEANGYEPYSLEGQLNFLMYDLSSLQAKYGRDLMAIENTAQGAYDAGYYFCYNYERPSNKAEKSDTRGTLARDTYWTKYGE